MAVPGFAPLPVPECTIHSATGKRKGPLALFTADRSAPRGSLGYVAGDPQLPGGTRLTLVPRPPGLPPPPARPTRGGWPVARLRAARCAPRASAGAASRSSSGPFEVEARTQGIPWGVLPRASLTECSIFDGPNDYLEQRCDPARNAVRLVPEPLSRKGDVSRSLFALAYTNHPRIVLDRRAVPTYIAVPVYAVW